MSIFMAYDVRGIYGKDLTAKTAYDIGESFALFLKRKKNRTVFLAMDNRSHSPKLKNPFKEALLQAGFNVVDIGIVSTPLMQFVLATRKAAGGCIVTASHNPRQYNGFKLYTGDRPLFSNEMQKLEKLFAKGSKMRGKSGRESVMDFEADYILDAAKRVSVRPGLKVVIDSGNGTCGPTARQFFERLGCKVTSLFEDMESAFLNHAPDPTKPENLQWVKKEVVKRRADIGIAFDGDGDRSVFIDEKGKQIRSDDAFVLFARTLAGKAKGRSFVYDLRFSKVVGEEINRLKGKPVMSKVGRNSIREEMHKRKALLGGEVSSHFFFADHYGFDDGIYAGAMLCQAISTTGQKLSTLTSSIPRYYSTSELRIECSNERKSLVVENVKKRLRKRFTVKTLDGVYVQLPNYWGSLRKSNTEPKITLRFEGKTRSDLKKVYGIFKKELEREDIKLPPLSKVIL